MKPEKRREQILRAATGVFAAKGYHRASVTDIINAAGIARGTFYLYFNGKREIFSELVDILTIRLSNSMSRIVIDDEHPPWTMQIKNNIARITTVLIEERELNQILYNHAMGLDEDFDKKIQQFYETITGRTEGAIKLGQEMGLVRKDVTPKIAALWTVGAAREVMYQISREKKPKVSADKLAEELVSIALGGIMLERTDTPRESGKRK